MKTFEGAVKQEKGIADFACGRGFSDCPGASGKLLPLQEQHGVYHSQ